MSQPCSDEEILKRLQSLNPQIERIDDISKMTFVETSSLPVFILQSQNSTSPFQQSEKEIKCSKCCKLPMSLCIELCMKFAFLLLLLLAMVCLTMFLFHAKMMSDFFSGES